MTKSRKSTASDKVIHVSIVGGGPAGISALLWARKLGLRSLLIEREAELGGQLSSIFNPIADYPGRATRGGAEMLRHFKKSLGDAGRSIIFGSSVEKIDVQRRELCLASGRLIQAKAIILAMGVRRRRLNIPGESEFAGKGILTSGAKEQLSLKGKRVAIVGGGDAAFENALILSKGAKRVYLIHRRAEFRARPEFVSRVQNNKRIEIVNDSLVTSIAGDDRLRSICVKEKMSGALRDLEVDALLIRIGVQPNSELARGKVTLDAAGYIIVDSRCQTSQPNLFAVGDIANPLSPTLATSAGTGASAAQSAAKLFSR